MFYGLAEWRPPGALPPADGSAACFRYIAACSWNLAGGVRLMFDTEDTARAIDPDWTAPTGDPRTALAFRCADPAEVDATHAVVVAAGHRSTLDPWDAPWGQRYASVADPDGGAVDLYAPLAADG